MSIKLFLGLAAEKRSIISEERKKVFLLKEEAMIIEIRNFQFSIIGSNVGVFIAFGIGGHGVAGNGHSHLNQIVS